MTAAAVAIRALLLMVVLFNTNVCDMRKSPQIKIFVFEYFAYSVKTRNAVDQPWICANQKVGDRRTLRSDRLKPGEI
jgi:hypothetical protein